MSTLYKCSAGDCVCTWQIQEYSYFLDRSCKVNNTWSLGQVLFPVYSKTQHIHDLQACKPAVKSTSFCICIRFGDLFMLFNISKWNRCSVLYYLWQDSLKVDVFRGQVRNTFHLCSDCGKNSEKVQWVFALAFKGLWRVK